MVISYFSAANILHKFSDSLAYFIRAIFLNEMNSVNGHFSLGWPTAAEFPLFTNEYGAWFGIDE